MSVGGFWLTYGSTITPFYNAYGAYSPDPSKPAEGLTSPQFAASFGTLTKDPTNSTQISWETNMQQASSSFAWVFSALST